MRPGFQSQKDVKPCRMKFRCKYQLQLIKGPLTLLCTIFLISYKLSDDGASKLRFRRQRYVSDGGTVADVCCHELFNISVISRLGFNFCFYMFKKQTVNCTLASRHRRLNWPYLYVGPYISRLLS